MLWAAERGTSGEYTDGRSGRPKRRRRSTLIGKSRGMMGMDEKESHEVIDFQAQRVSCSSGLFEGGEKEAVASSSSLRWYGMPRCSDTIA